MTRLTLGVLSLLFAMAAQAWWSEEWSQRKTITVNTTPTGSNTQQGLTEVPVLVRLHSGNFPQFLNVRENGADLRFVAGDDVTPLKYHIERFDPISELAYVWVKLPIVNPLSDQGQFYLYFGNPQAPRGDDPGATWDVNTVAAFHFSESSGLPVDSTAYGTAMIAGQPIPNPASLIGGGATLTGSPLVLGDAPQLQFAAASGWTIYLWVRVPELPAEPMLLVQRPGDDGGFAITLGADGLVARYADTEVRSFVPPVSGQWQHVAVVVDAAQMQLFLNGTQVGGAPVTAVDQAGPIFIGGGVDGEAPLLGDIDELRIANVARPAEWIGFAAAIQGTGNDRVLGYSVDESAEGAGQATTGNFGIIFQNVFGKKEAWVEQAVIILCGLMMAIAAAIMFLKAVDLRRASVASKRFLKAYATLVSLRQDDVPPGGDGTATTLDALYAAKNAFGDSPLWRVYHAGIEELRSRMSPAIGAAAAGLDSKAMTVLRARMDATMVRETQRLNSMLVLLTIAISGGPFIGLLGTVVGVMVTFAAIAATGDVNIAAIAPGMAAALLATVAGLGVAIPSLFGYNWLSSRAKALGADMRVFADELEARVNERYGA